MGNDCSQRVCPFDYAFVDTARGDLNHDGLLDSAGVPVQWSNVAEYEVWPRKGTVFNPVTDEAHFYAECSGKGSCNRDTGECQCFAGFTGSACQRTTCPKDCSGHGICRTLREVAITGANKRETKSVAGHKYFTGVSAPFDYNRWDADKQQTCVCDPSYHGPDCSLRSCPRGDDPLTNTDRWCGGAACTWEVQSLTFASGGTTTFRIGYTDYLNRTHYAYATLDTQDPATGWVAVADRTTKLPGPTTTAGKLMAALRNLPGGVLSRVEVYPLADATSMTYQSRTYEITFVGVSGDVAPLTVKVVNGNSALDCNPDHSTFTATACPASSKAVVEVSRGNYENLVCSGRGTCDSTSGVCKCFTGYTGEACSIQNALPY